MSRNVIVVSPSANQPKRVATSATTWGELKRQSDVASLVNGEVDAIVTPGRLTLGSDDSILPTGDFNLYLITKKNKAGMADYSEIGDAISDAIQKAANKAGEEEVSNLKNELLEVIADHFDVELSDIVEASPTSDPELTAAMNEFQRLNS